MNFILGFEYGNTTSPKNVFFDLPGEILNHQGMPQPKTGNTKNSILILKIYRNLSLHYIFRMSHMVHLARELMVDLELLTCGGKPVS